jgi:2,4-dichlorophenol 6-monooxygenase
MQPGADVGGIGMGLVRMVRPWNEWLIVWGYDINEPARGGRAPWPPGRAAAWSAIRSWRSNCSRQHLDGQQHVRHAHAEGPGLHHGRRGAPASAVERAGLEHVDPGQLQPCLETGRGLKGQAGAALLDSYSAERAPVAKQIVTRANQSIGEFGPIFEALGMTGGTDPEVIQANMDARCDAGPPRPRNSATPSARRSPSRSTSSTPTAWR